MNEDFFSPRRQFFRVLGQDWRLFRLDLLWGAAYAVAGFFLPSRRIPLIDGQHQLLGPFALLGLAVALMALRLCAVESEPGIAGYYFNLPRSRMLAWAAHAVVLGLMATAHEGLILFLAALGLNLPPGAEHYAIAPHRLLYPFLALSYAIWVGCLPRRVNWQVIPPIFVILLVIILIVGADIVAKKTTPTAECVLTASFALLAFSILAHAWNRWRRRQIGVLS